MQSRDGGRQENGREEAATTGGEHRQRPLFTGNTHHITVKAEEGQASQLAEVLGDAEPSFTYALSEPNTALY